MSRVLIVSQQTPGSESSREAPRILVAEDSPTMREVARGLLEHAGFAVDLAADGSAAVTRATEHRYDLILMDINMPRVNGIEAAAMIRAAGVSAAATPILAMTAEKGPDRLEDILEAGMNGYLPKPFGRVQLLEAIAPWIRAAEAA